MSQPTSAKEREVMWARAAAAKTPEYPTGLKLFPATDTGGVMPMTLLGRFAQERERLGPEFTDAERKWRIKWHRDQNLHPSEPLKVPQLYRALRNPLRRWYQKPLNYLEQQVLQPRLGQEWAFIVRQALGKGTLIWLTLCYTWYWAKYNNRTWERLGGMGVRVSRTPSLPGNPTYPVVDPRPNPEDYHDYGFKGQPFHPYR